MKNCFDELTALAASVTNGCNLAYQQIFGYGALSEALYKIQSAELEHASPKAHAELSVITANLLPEIQIRLDRVKHEIRESLSAAATKKPEEV